MEGDKENLVEKVRSLVQELEGAKRNQSNAAADAALREEILQHKKKIQEMEEQFVLERQKNLQLRMKSGKAFMAALNDPDYQVTGGKAIEEAHDPDDDYALMRLLKTIEEMGEATLEQKLDKYAGVNDYMSQKQWHQLLEYHKTLATDYIRLDRIAGFAFMTTDVKKQKVAEIMRRINGRAAMTERIQEQTLIHIATYMDKQEYDINALFRRFNTDADDHLSEAEFFDMLGILHINVNRQLKRILYSMFDADRNGQISKAELTQRLSKYTKKAPITVEQIESNIIKEEDKKELVEMWNEENRQKAVFEDFGFAADDMDELERRKQETLQLIRDGVLPDQ